MLTDIEIAFLLRAAALVCQRMALVGTVDDDGVEFGQTAQGLFEAAQERMERGLRAKAKPARALRHEDFACGHVRPTEGQGNRLGSKYTVICESPREHSGDHEHYGYHWPNLGDDPLLDVDFP